jgi:hypothetical protein
MSLSSLLTKHKKEGFTAIPVAEQIEMCRNAMGDGGVNLTKLNELVAKHFNVQDDPRNYGHFDCKIYFNIPERDAETYVRNNFDAMFSFIDADKITTADGHWAKRVADDDFTFLSRERGGIYSQSDGNKDDVVQYLTRLLCEPFPDFG